MKKSEINEYGKMLGRKHNPASGSGKSKTPASQPKTDEETHAGSPPDARKRVKKIQDYF